MTKKKAINLVNLTHTITLFILLAGVWYITNNPQHSYIGYIIGLIITIPPLTAYEIIIKKLDKTYVSDSYQTDKLIIKKLIFAMKQHDRLERTDEQLKIAAEAIYYCDEVIL